MLMSANIHDPGALTVRRSCMSRAVYLLLVFIASDLHTNRFVVRQPATCLSLPSCFQAYHVCASVCPWKTCIFVVYPRTANRRRETLFPFITCESANARTQDLLAPCRQSSHESNSYINGVCDIGSGRIVHHGCNRRQIPGLL